MIEYFTEILVNKIIFTQETNARRISFSNKVFYIQPIKQKSNNSYSTAKWTLHVNCNIQRFSFKK